MARIERCPVCDGEVSESRLRALGDLAVELRMQVPRDTASRSTAQSAGAAVREGVCEWCDADFVDRSRAQARRFCSDNCRKRAHDDAHRERGVCTDCGGPRGQWVERGEGRCGDCADREVERKRGLIVAGYREGLTSYEIAERTGIPIQSVKSEAHRLRKAGVHVPLSPTGRAAHRARRAA